MAAKRFDVRDSKRLSWLCRRARRGRYQKKPAGGVWRV